jgi:hypothetical protein
MQYSRRKVIEIEIFPVSISRVVKRLKDARNSAGLCHRVLPVVSYLVRIVNALYTFF